MRWWREHGEMVVMCVALVAIFHDPIDRWLPVAMPELEPGPQTTWMPGVVLADGIADYATTINRDDAERLEAGAAGREILQEVRSAQVDGSSLTDCLLSLHTPTGEESAPLVDLSLLLLKGDVERAKPNDHAKRDQWMERCHTAVDELVRLPRSATLAVPVPSGRANRGHLELLRAPGSQLALMHLASATVDRGRAAAANDRVGCITSIERLLRLAELTAGIHDVPSHAAARGMRAAAWRLALDGIAGAPRDAELRTALRAALEASAPLPTPEGTLRILRVLSLRFVMSIDRNLRGGKGAAGLRANRPPDVNEGLRLINAWFDRIEATLPRPLDETGLRSLAGALPLPAAAEELAAETAPLANRMLFRDPVVERRRESARHVAFLTSASAWLALNALSHEAASEADARHVLTAVLSMPPGDDPDAYTSALRDHLAAALGSDSPRVASEGGVVSVTALPRASPSSAQAAAQVKKAIRAATVTPSTHTLFRIDLASPP